MVDPGLLKSPWEHPPRSVGRYTLYGEIASGGMASVHIGRLVGPVGFLRTVAIKCLHPQFAKDPSFVDMFLDEARLAARIRHPNVVSTLEIVNIESELFLVMDYVHGESLGRLVRAAGVGESRLSPRVVSAIMVGALLGLHAAHEATNEHGQALSIVHRDVSPQNILVGTDGVSRVADFGVAKAALRVHTTRGGDLKGKIAYMAPEQLLQEDLDRRTDLFGASVCLWEALAGRRLFPMSDIGSAVKRLLENTQPDPPSLHAPGLSPEVDALVLKGLARRREDRFATAREMAVALEAAIPPAGALEVGSAVETWAHEALELRSENTALRVSGRPLASLSFSDSTKLLGSNVASISSPPTGVTEISLTVATPSSNPRRRVGFGVAAAVVAVAGLGVVVFGVQRTSAPLGPSTATLSALGSATKVPAPSPTGVSDSTSAPAGPTASPSASPPIDPSVPVVAAGARRAPAPAPRFTKPAKRNCDPPYVLNPDGSKRFKAECF